MPIHFHIAIVQPPPFDVVFDDLAKLIALSLTDLGHVASATHGPPRPDTRNIILGYGGAPDLSVIRGNIVYQLEPLSLQNPAYSPQWIDRLRLASEVWDYSPQNVEFLAARTIRARLVPIGFHPALATIDPDAPTVIDVLHYGNCSDRRAVVINELMTKCRTVNLARRFGQERDRYIASAKIILNLHYFPDQAFEAVRVSYLLNNSRLVVAEESLDNPYDGIMITAPYDRLVDTCMTWLKRPPDERNAVARAGFEQFRQTPMSGHLARVL